MKPGGIVAFITSRYTLDKVSSRVRRHIAEHAELLAAARLPESAFRKNAGTEVVTDVLILRKKFKPSGIDEKLSWIETDVFPNGMDYRVPVNRLYIERPDLMLGVPGCSRGMYNDCEFTLKPDGRNLAEALRDSLISPLPSQAAPASQPSLLAPSLMEDAQEKEAGAHLRQLYFAVDRESRSRGAGARIIGCYRGFEIVAHAYGRQLDALSALFSDTDLFLRAGENELSYSVNLGESDVGVIQSMDAQLRGLEGKLEKSLAEQAELEHRQRRIAAELDKGFEHAARYEELRLRLNALTQELTKAGLEIEASPELSNLDEDAFRHVDAGASFHQISSLAGQIVETGKENAVALSAQAPIVSESPAVESECVTTIAADLQPAHKEDKTDQSRIKAEAAGGSKNGRFTRPEKDHSETSTAAKRGAASKGAMAKGPPRQMTFDWS